MRAVIAVSSIFIAFFAVYAAPFVESAQAAAQAILP